MATIQNTNLEVLRGSKYNLTLIGLLYQLQSLKIKSRCEELPLSLVLSESKNWGLNQEGLTLYLQKLRKYGLVEPTEDGKSIYLCFSDFARREDIDERTAPKEELGKAENTEVLTPQERARLQRLNAIKSRWAKVKEEQKREEERSAKTSLQMQNLIKKRWAKRNILDVLASKYEQNTTEYGFIRSKYEQNTIELGFSGEKYGSIRYNTDLYEIYTRLYENLPSKLIENISKRVKSELNFAFLEEEKNNLTAENSLNGQKKNIYNIYLFYNIIKEEIYRYYDLILLNRDKGVWGKRGREISHESENALNSENENVLNLEIKTERVSADEFLKIWNERCQILPNVFRLSKTRRAKVEEMLNLLGTARQEQEKAINQIIENINNSDFLQGKGRKWRMSFDWLIASEDNWLKVLEGAYFSMPTKSEERTKKEELDDAILHPNKYWEEWEKQMKTNKQGGFT